MPACVVTERRRRTASDTGRVLSRRNVSFFLDALPVVGLQYLLALRFRSFVIPLAAGLALWIAALGGLPWEFNYVIPYSYPAIDYTLGRSLARQPRPARQHTDACNRVVRGSHRRRLRSLRDAQRSRLSLTSHSRTARRTSAPHVARGTERPHVARRTSHVTGFCNTIPADASYTTGMDLHGRGLAAGGAHWRGSRPNRRSVVAGVRIGAQTYVFRGPAARPGAGGVQGRRPQLRRAVVGARGDRRRDRRDRGHRREARRELLRTWRTKGPLSPFEAIRAQVRRRRRDADVLRRAVSRRLVRRGDHALLRDGQGARRQRDHLVGRHLGRAARRAAARGQRRQGRRSTTTRPSGRTSSRRRRTSPPR